MSQVVASWSGGKESCFSLYKAISSGFKVSHLLNFILHNGRCMSHGLDSKLIAAQSEAIDIPIVQRKVTWNTYEEEFKKAISEFKKMGWREESSVMLMFKSTRTGCIKSVANWTLSQ